MFFHMRFDLQNSWLEALCWILTLWSLVTKSQDHTLKSKVEAVEWPIWGRKPQSQRFSYHAIRGRAYGSFGLKFLDGKGREDKGWPRQLIREIRWLRVACAVCWIVAMMQKGTVSRLSYGAARLTCALAHDKPLRFWLVSPFFGVLCNYQRLCQFPDALHVILGHLAANMTTSKALSTWRSLPKSPFWVGISFQGCSALALGLVGLVGLYGSLLRKVVQKWSKRPRFRSIYRSTNGIMMWI